MKVLYYLSIALIAFTSCVQPSKRKDETTQTMETTHDRYKVLDIIDTISAQYPNKYVNDIQKERFLAYMYMEIDARLNADNDLLAEIPLQFMQMLRKGNKYIVKFECGEYTTNDKGLYSKEGNYKLNYIIFAEVTEDFASELEEKSIYKLTGTYVGYSKDHLRLPSGRMAVCMPSCYYEPFKKEGNIALGGFLFRDIKVKCTY